MTALRVVVAGAAANIFSDVYPLVASSPVFDHYYELEPGSVLRLSHRLLVADGVWSGERLARELQPWLEP
jgi:hypothetical protein